MQSRRKVTKTGSGCVLPDPFVVELRDFEITRFNEAASSQPRGTNKPPQ